MRIVLLSILFCASICAQSADGCGVCQDGFTGPLSCWQCHAACSYDNVIGDYAYGVCTDCQGNISSQCLDITPIINSALTAKQISEARAKGLLVRPGKLTPYVVWLRKSGMDAAHGRMPHPAPSKSPASPWAKWAAANMHPTRCKPSATHPTGAQLATHLPPQR